MHKPALQGRIKVIELVEVCKVYHRGPEAIQALDHLNVRIGSGEFVAITGKSGCGKSTLLHIIGGLESVSCGRVFLDGCDLANLREPERTRFRRDRVGVVFQSFNLLPLLTLEENVALPRVLQGASYAQAQQEALPQVEGHVDAARRDGLKGAFRFHVREERLLVAYGVVRVPE